MFCKLLNLSMSLLDSGKVYTDTLMSSLQQTAKAYTDSLMSPLQQTSKDVNEYKFKLNEVFLCFTIGNLVWLFILDLDRIVLYINVVKNICCQHVSG